MIPLKILIVRFSSIGDIVLTTPIIRCLKQQAGATVHYLCKSAYQSVIAANPYIDKIYTIDKDVVEVVGALKKEGYDGVVDLHKNFRTLQLKLRLGINVYTFNKINTQKWLMVNLKWNKLPHKHIVDRYFEAVRPLGIENDGKGLDYFYKAADEIDLEKFLPENGLPYFNSNFVALVIGAAHATKRMPESFLLKICEILPIPVILLGGPGDKDLAEALVQKSNKKLISACGKLNLNQSASLIKQAQLVISNDTGLMHIAAAFQKKIISVWGNTIPEFGMYPYLNGKKEAEFRMEVKGLNCRPCSKIGHDKCPKSHFNCMENQDIDQLKYLLNKSGFVI